MLIDFYYKMFLKTLLMLKKVRLYNVPKVKGILYTFFSSLLTFSIKVNLLGGKDLNNGTTITQRNTPIIISLTSYPKRINEVYYTLISIILQQTKPDRIILWLSKEEFPRELSDIPLKLTKLLNKGVEIYFCDNLKPHKKYYYSMKENPKAVIITVDDDVFYPSDFIGELLRLWNKYPKNIICTRGHLMKINDNRIAPYDIWVSNPELDEKPHMWICPTGVGGVLYPPQSLSNRVFDKAKIKECLNADDLWLKIMGLINNTKVVKSSKYPYCFLTVGKTQKTSLSQTNVLKKKNNEQLIKIMQYYGELINYKQ